MTWNPLKRNYLNQRPTSAHPCLTVAEDRELDITVQRLMNIENVVRNLIKEMKKFVETKISIDKGDQRLTSDLRQCPLVNRNDKFRILVEEYLSVTSQNGLTLQDTIMLFQKTFIEPLKRLREELIYIKDMLCKREDLVNVWKNSYSNLKKLQEKREKTASHIVKLEKEKKTEEFLAKQLKICHSQLISELPVFLEKRLDYLKPTIQAFIAIQLESYGNSTKTFTQLMPNSNSSSSPSSMVDEEHNQTVNAHLNLIKNLTIIKND